MHRAAVTLGFWSAFLAIYDVLQKKAFQFIDWLVTQDFCGRRTFDQNGKGVLRYLAIDASEIESRQVASNQSAPALTLSLESGNQTTSSQGPANLPAVAEGADRQRNEVQRLATISEVAIAVFVLLCGVAMAALLRMKRVSS